MSELLFLIYFYLRDSKCLEDAFLLLKDLGDRIFLSFYFKDKEDLLTLIFPFLHDINSFLSFSLM